jgi:exodeoxyribonuclease VII large subunit
LTQVLQRIEQAEQRITSYARGQIDSQRTLLASLAVRIPTLFSLVRTREESQLDRHRQRMAVAAHRRIEKHAERLDAISYQLATIIRQHLTQGRHRLELLEQRSRALDPQLILNRGYSITLMHGKAINKASQLKPGDEIETRLSKGTIKSVVK